MPAASKKSQLIIPAEATPWIMAWFGFICCSVFIGLPVNMLLENYAVPYDSNLSALVGVGALIFLVLPSTYLIATKSTPNFCQRVLNANTALLLLYVVLTLPSVIVTMTIWYSYQLPYEWIESKLTLIPFITFSISGIIAIIVQHKHWFSRIFRQFPYRINYALCILLGITFLPIAAGGRNNRWVIDGNSYIIPLPLTERVMETYPWTSAFHAMYRLDTDITFGLLFFWLWVPAMCWLLLLTLASHARKRAKYWL